MGNTHRYVAIAARRFYGAHWVKFCDLMRVDPQKVAEFDKTDVMIGVKLDRSEYSDERIADSLKSLRMVYSTTIEGLPTRCYLHGTKYFKFIYFESIVAISEDTHEIVRQFTVKD